MLIAWANRKEIVFFIFSNARAYNFQIYVQTNCVFFFLYLIRAGVCIDENVIAPVPLFYSTV